MKRIICNPVLKDTVTFVQTVAESAGNATELEATVMPGGGNPLHFHRTYEETVTVLEGKITLQLAKGSCIELSPGESYRIKAGLAHGFTNNSDGEVKVRSHISPGSEGFESALRIMYGLAVDGLYNRRRMPRSLQAFAICASISDTRLPGFMSLLNPAIDLLARFARWRGVEAQLRSKYCV